LKNITSSTFCTAIGTGCTAGQVTIDTTTKNGWYINLSTNLVTRSDGTTITSPVGEKMISDPTVFGGVVYFTTHVPDQGAGSACGLSGDAFLYGINYLTGSGALTEPGAPPPEPGALVAGSRTNYIGHGIASAPVLSMRPGGSGLMDIYATASGGAGTSALTQKLGNAPSTASMNNIIYWKDRRLQ
jgi:Tfp pilus tip-associated adhesin PilY1